MKILIKAKPNSRMESIKELDKNSFEVCVKEPPIKGRANAAIIMALAKHFKTPLSAVRIISGHTSRQKVVEINF